MLDTATRQSFQQRFSLIRGLEKEDLAPAGNTFTLQDAGEGAFFELDNQTYVVREISRYEETSEDFKTPQGYYIYELTCFNLDTGETTHFEWEYDDELEIAMTLERFSFRHLTDDAGEAVDEDDLDQIAEDKDSVVLKNETFWYEDDWAAVYQRGSKTEKVYFYEFENQSHTRFLTIEEWQGSSRDEYRIYTSVPVNPAQIRMVSKGGRQP